MLQVAVRGVCGELHEREGAGGPRCWARTSRTANTPHTHTHAHTTHTPRTALLAGGFPLCPCCAASTCAAASLLCSARGLASAPRAQPRGRTPVAERLLGLRLQRAGRSTASMPERTRSGRPSWRRAAGSRPSPARGSRRRRRRLRLRPKRPPTCPGSLACGKGVFMHMCCYEHQIVRSNNTLTQALAATRPAHPSRRDGASRTQAVASPPSRTPLTS